MEERKEGTEAKADVHAKDNGLGCSSNKIHSQYAVMWGSTTGCLEYAGVLMQHVQGESDRVRQEERMRRKDKNKAVYGQ